MRYFLSPLRAVAATAALLLSSVNTTALMAEIIVDFEDVGLGVNSFNNGQSGLPTSGGVSFQNDYDTTFGSWSGWAFSTVTNGNVGGFSNQYASRPGGAFSGSTYAVAYANSRMSALNSRTLPSSSINFNQQVIANSVRLTNTAYTFFDLRDGSAFSRKFGDGNDDGTLDGAPDLFSLRILGYRLGVQTGTFADFNLADFRFADNSLDNIVDAWQLVDLSGLGVVDELQFQLLSTDFSDFTDYADLPIDLQIYINGPSYFAIDDLRVTAVPEPSSVALVGLGVTAWGVRRYRKRVAARA